MLKPTAQAGRTVFLGHDPENTLKSRQSIINNASTDNTNKPDDMWVGTAGDPTGAGSEVFTAEVEPDEEKR